jgi:Flp pilus assembly protein TadD
MRCHCASLIFASGLAALFGWLSWQRVSFYCDVESLWRDNVTHEQNSAVAWGCLGLLLMDQQRFAEAVEPLKQSLTINPRRAKPHLNLGTVYQRLGMFAEAAKEFRIGLEIVPDDADAHNSYGAALASLGRHDEAIGEYQAALKITGHCTDAWINLLDSLAAQGRQADVVTVFRAGEAYASRYDRTALRNRLNEWAEKHLQRPPADEMSR